MLVYYFHEFLIVTAHTFREYMVGKRYTQQPHTLVDWTR